MINSDKPTDERCVVNAKSTEAEENTVMSDVIHGVPATVNVAQDVMLGIRGLQQINKYVHNGWLDKVDNDLMENFRQYDGSSINDPCPIFRVRLLFQATLGTWRLKQPHSDHPGVQHIKSLASSYVHWPLTDRNADYTAKKCSQCVQAPNTPLQVQPSPWPSVEQLWPCVRVYLSGSTNDQHFLTIVDDGFAQCVVSWGSQQSTSWTDLSTTLVTDNEPQISSKI